MHTNNFDFYDLENVNDVVSPLQESLLKGSIKEIQQILCQNYGARLSSQTDEIHKRKEIVDICLDQKIDVNLAETKYSALLHFVAVKLDEETFKNVLNRSSAFNINALYKGRALFHWVAGKENLVQEVIEFGEVRNMKYWEDETPVGFAKVLLEFGADVNIKDYFKKTPLYYAVSGNNTKLTRFLLDNGATIQEDISPLENIFDYDFSLPDMEIVLMLLEAGCEVNPKNNRTLTIDSLFFENPAVDSETSIRNREIVKLLCAHGAEICLENEKGIGILHSFCKSGRFEDVRFCVKYGADLFSRQNGRTTLHKAVFGNNFDLVDFLLSNGLDINVKDDEGKTPLHRLSNFSSYAKKENEIVKMIEFLVDNGADVNAIDKYLITPLTNSIVCNSVEISECILELNANFDFRNFDYFYHCSLSSSDAYAGISPKKYSTFKLLTAFLTMKEKDISQIINNTQYSTEFEWVELLFQKCKIEVNAMKSKNIYQHRNISFFDFLSKDLMKVTFFCSSEEIMLVLESGEYKNEFPSYEYLLGKRIERVKLLRNYINVFTHFLEQLFSKRLPLVVLDIILSFLIVGDLRNFARALRISEDFPNGKYCFIE